MVKDYTTDLYEPAAAHDDDMAADGHRRSRQIAAWKERITSSWSGVRVDAVESDGTMPGIGDERSVDAVVALGSLTGDDVEVQLVHGIVGQGDETERPPHTTLAEVARGAHSGARSRGAVPFERARAHRSTARG